MPKGKNYQEHLKAQSKKPNVLNRFFHEIKDQLFKGKNFLDEVHARQNADLKKAKETPANGQIAPDPNTSKTTKPPLDSSKQGPT